MKFKMPSNSLFSLLLRKPWWISLLIAVVLGVAAAALLPREFRVVGAVSGFPFLVIAAMAAKRQWGLPSAARVLQTQDAVSAMTWPVFSAVLTQALARDGYVVTPGKAEAVDLLVERQGRVMVVCARRWKSARVGIETLRALQASCDNLEAAQALCICLGELTDNARPFATAKGITVWQAAELALALRGMDLLAAKPR
jgi:restriction system protein